MLIICSVGWLQTLKLNLTALKLAGKIPFALYEALPEFEDSILEHDGGAKKQKVYCRYFLASITLKTLIFV